MARKSKTPDDEILDDANLDDEILDDANLDDVDNADQSVNGASNSSASNSNSVITDNDIATPEEVAPEETSKETTPETSEETSEETTPEATPEGTTPEYVDLEEKLRAGSSSIVEELYDESSERIIAELVELNQQGATEEEKSDRVNKILEEIMRKRDMEAYNIGIPVLTVGEREQLQELFSQLFGLGKLETWLNIPNAENVYIFGSSKVIVKYNTGASKSFPIRLSDEELITTIRFLATTKSRTSRRFDVAEPILDLRLPTNHRLFAVMGVSHEPYVVIRYHSKEKMDLDRLAELGTLNPEMVEFLRSAITSSRPANMLISGGTSTGKTTTLRAFLNEVPKEEILVTIEDTLELQLRQTGQHENCFELETRESNVEGIGEINMYALTKAALRMAPDRVIIGEVRGGEIMQLLNAMGQGNDGSIGTIHADSSESVVSRILTYSQRSLDASSPDFVLRQVGQTLDMIIFISLLPGQKRQITSIREVLGYYKGEVHTSEIFGMDENSKTVYRRAPHPDGKLIQKLKVTGYDIDKLGTPEIKKPVDFFKEQ